MCRRAEAEEIEQKPLVITLVAVRQEAGLGLPAVSERRTAVTRPVPVGPAVERVGQAADLRLVLGVGVEVGAAGERAREQERRVERGQFAVPDAPAGVDVKEVVEEAFVPSYIRPRPLREVEEVAEPTTGELRRELADDHAALDDDRDRRQTQADCGDAGRGVQIGLVPDQPIIRVGLVQVVMDCRPLQLIQVLVRRQPVQLVFERSQFGHCPILRIIPFRLGRHARGRRSGAPRSRPKLADRPR